jgi:hypothetical protein
MVKLVDVDIINTKQAQGRFEFFARTFCVTLQGFGGKDKIISSAADGLYYDFLIFAVPVGSGGVNVVYPAVQRSAI